jgi:hypothetical protein
MTPAGNWGYLVRMPTSSTTQLPDTSRINEKGAFASSLTDARQRYLAQVIAHALSTGRRDAKDFVRHFPPKVLMAALVDQPRLRANIVVPTIGIHEKVALKKSAESTGEDLQLALDEGVTDAEAIVALLDPDDRVRHLDDKKLWAFLVEGEFWKATTASGVEFAVARRHVAFMLDCGRDNGLLTGKDIVEACTLEAIVESLPKAEVARLLTVALSAGREGRPFNDEALLAAESTAALLEHLPLEYVWDKVVFPKIAVAHGLTRAGPGVQSASPAVAPPLPRFEDDEVIVIEVDRVSEPGPERAQRGRRVGGEVAPAPKTKSG